MALVAVRSILRSHLPAVSDTSVSGRMSFAITNAAGADMTDTVTRCGAYSGPRRLMYTAITDPAMFANPPIINALSSDIVMRATYGFTTSGASVCPRKMLAALAIDSAPDNPMN